MKALLKFEVILTIRLRTYRIDEFGDGALEALHYRLTLPCCPLTLKLATLCLRLAVLDLQDPLCGVVWRV